MTRKPAAIVPRNIVARYAYHLSVDFIPVSLASLVLGGMDLPTSRTTTVAARATSPT
jgi:hypothetical protein